MAQHAYHTLLTRDLRHADFNHWCIAFGDSDKNVVKVERDDYRDQGYAAAELHIIQTTPDQRSVEAAVATLNAVESAKIARK